MFVNKNKQAIVRLQEYLTWMATFFPYRSQALNNFQEQLFPECQVHPHTAMLVLSRPEVKKNYLNNIELWDQKLSRSLCSQMEFTAFTCSWTKMLHPSNRMICWDFEKWNKKTLRCHILAPAQKQREAANILWKGCHKITLQHAGKGEASVQVFKTTSGLVSY